MAEHRLAIKINKTNQFEKAIKVFRDDFWTPMQQVEEGDPEKAANNIRAYVMATMKKKKPRDQPKL